MVDVPAVYRDDTEEGEEGDEGDEGVVALVFKVSNVYARRARVGGNWCGGDDWSL